MLTFSLVFGLATLAPLADAPGALAPFEHACSAGLPKERHFVYADLERALVRLRQTGSKYRLRSWALTCDTAVLCQRRPTSGKCPAIFGQAPPWGATYRGGELLLLVDDPNTGGATTVYAIPALEGRQWTGGYPVPGGPVVAIDGPAFE